MTAAAASGQDRRVECFHHPAQARHAPAFEMHNGRLIASLEVPDRAQAIATRLGPMAAPADFGMEPIAAVHSAEYLQFLASGHDEWRAAGRDGEALPYVWPVVGRRPLTLARIDARLGRFSFDATTPLGPDTFESAYASAQTGLAAAAAVRAGARAAFGLCRPPGHHAGADYMGGYCYLNAAAIAAHWLGVAYGGRVAVLDIDYHHGNGTQDIFWRRGDVFFASIHADPSGDYPFYWGHADERGEGEGSGTTLNLPLPRGTGADAYRRALGEALAAISDFAPSALVVSFGADTHEDDPIGGFCLQTPDFRRIAGDIAACGWPTAILMEGGYAVDRLADSVTGFLDGFA